MKARYISLHRLLGANKLVEGSDAEVFSSAAPELRVYLTERPHEILRIFDRASALGELLLTAFTGATAGMSAEQALEEKISRLESKRTVGGVYVVFDGFIDIVQPNLTHRRPVGDIDLALDAIDKKIIREAFDLSIDRILMAIKLGQPDEADWHTEQVGNVVLLLDGTKEVYPFSLEAGSAQINIAMPLAVESIARSAQLSHKLKRANYLDRVVRLFVESSKRGVDPLFAFIAAWSALEIFVGTTFKNTYQKRWYSMLEAGVPVSAKSVIKRLEDVMSDKLRLSDKFGVVASLLDADMAEHDLQQFNNIKKIRDDFFHTPEPGRVALPLSEIHILLRKYLNLHLGSER